MIERRAVLLAGSLPLLLISSPASALDYAAPAVCPSQADFMASIARRGVLIEGATTELAVRITQDSNGFSGELSVVLGEGDSEPRRVSDADCSRVTEGLAAVAAIVLGARPSEATEPTFEEQPTPAPARAEPARPAVGVATPVEDPPLQGSAFTREDDLWVERGRLEIRPSQAWTFTGGADFGTIPGLVLPRYDLTASLATFLVTPDEATHLVGPLLQVRWSFVGPGTHESTTGIETDVWGIHAGAASCFPFNYDTRGLTVLGCAEFMAEYMHLATATPNGLLEQDTGSGSAGLALDARYAIGAGFHVGLRAGGRLRFGKLTARDEQDQVLFESGMMGGFVTAGLGYAF